MTIRANMSRTRAGFALGFATGRVLALPRIATILIMLIMSIMSLLAAPARAEVPLMAEGLPADLEGVGVTERLDESVPLDLELIDASGKTVRLGDYFEPGKPVILTLNFYRCEMLCDTTLNGLLDSIREIEWTAGKEYRIVTVSFAPEEEPELASVKGRAYLSRYGREDARWDFHVATPESIRALTEAVGFRYRKLESGQYAHTSTIMFLTPDGRLSRYMNDVVFDPADVRLALVEASEGSIGTPMERILLFSCYAYDPDANSYAVSAVKVMRLAGALTVVAITAGLVVLSVRGACQRRCAERAGGRCAERAVGQMRGAPFADTAALSGEARSGLQP